MDTVTRGSSVSERRRRALICRATAGLVASVGMGAAQGGSWIIEPQVSVSEIYSSNLALAATSPVSGLASDIAPGIAINGAGARVKGFLDYKRDFLFYEGNSQYNRRQNQLKSFANVEAIEKWFYIDVSANIVQRNLSVFSPSSFNQTSAGAALAETKTYQVSPYIRSRFSNAAEYLVRLDSIDCRSDDPTLVPTRVNQLVGSLKSLATSGTIGWFSDFNGTDVRNDVLGSRNDARIRAGVVLPLGDKAHLSLSDGRESTDFASRNTEKLSTPGIGFDWSPSAHTKVAALEEKRFYGNGHNILMTHLTPMTAWRYSDVKDIAILPTVLSGFNPGSIYQLMSNLLEASIPNPLDRSREVRARMDQLGTAAPLAEGAGVQTSRLYVDRLQEASVAMLGKRNTVTLVVSQRTQQLPAFAPPANDNFNQDSDIRQRGASVTWLHRLTPESVLSVAVLHMKTADLSTSASQSVQTMMSAYATVHLTQKTAAAVGVRRTYGDNSATGSFKESALLGSVVQRF